MVIKVSGDYKMVSGSWSLVFGFNLPPTRKKLQDIFGFQRPGINSVKILTARFAQDARGAKKKRFRDRNDRSQKGGPHSIQGEG